MALNLGDADFEDMQPEVGAFRVAEAAWANMGLTGTATGAITSGIEREGLSNIGKKLPPEQANKMFQGLGADRDITVAEAEYIMEKKNEIRQNQEVIDLASDSFLKGTVMPFVAGAARAMTDPIDMGVNLITGGIGSALAKGGTIGRRISIDAAEAAAAATIAEAPVAKEMTETFEEYTSKDFLTNVIGASIMQIGLTHGTVGAWKGTSKALDMAGNKTSDNLMKLADTLESKGISSFKAVSHMVDKLKKTFSTDKELNLAVKNTFGDKVETGDLKTTMKNVVKAHEDGLVTDQDLIQFKENAIEAGVDERALQSAIDNEKPYSYRDDEVSEFKDIVNDERSKADFNEEAYNADRELDGFDPDLVIRDKIETAKKMAQQEDADPIVKGINEEINVKTKEQNFFREFAECRRSIG